ncbi:putative glycolipid-binding domain-containing protein [Brachybacterium sacelli]|uniref:Glycolipid-binding domain-containing protein n=1 Tax=Brachybacterium sacelli TaxID=173364 RepID=A0ABS4WWB6_9MICO|nr:putative glycolipid-binding domain-containing protein [Brachybacterium sacelli]MBP2380505.1 hypothetical protein [Brachybacterium sacelli]
MVQIEWTGVASRSVERCEVDERAGSVLVTSTIEDAENTCSYQLHAHVDWRFADLTMWMAGRSLIVVRREGVWVVDGQTRPDLYEASEIDLSVSPLSNTLPIRRLRLEVGQSADIITAYITVPELEVSTEPLRYTRLSEHEYLYELRNSEFHRTILVDDTGLVIDYPGLFTSNAR